MKIKHIIPIFILVSTIASCELETSNNGKLDGMWKMSSIDTITSDGVNDLSNKRLFWSVQNKLLQVNDADGVCSEVLLRFNHTGDSLLLSDPYGYDRDDGDSVLTDLSVLKPYGINAANEKYKVLQLNSSDMTLQSATLRIHFYKY